MLNSIALHTVRFFALILLQALVIDNIELGSLSNYINPFIFIMFLMMLPFETPNWLLLVLGLVTGLVMDMFTNTQGMHASACVTLAFARPLVLTLIRPREGYEFGAQPTMRSMGLSWFVVYATMIILVHHLWLFSIEVFRFSEYYLVLMKVLLSGCFTLILLILGQFLVFKPRDQS